MKIFIVIIQITKFDEKKVIIIGNNNAISISKIKKIIVIKKNRRENGIRALKIGLNPHSNGDIFSLSIFIFFDIIIDNFMIIMGIIMIIMEFNEIKNIIFIII